ncbi:Pr6Pr family membrane protein [Luteimonas sp. SX5]|uniref:Pr6Pr family membrane protein n=1 Tax=Luteimonas galliterrae TaxID=2940486 RepID=A0ABT0MH98_9GAMM|nr:Pr6Pr family membrane protein [Luteimonas galliterrae]MCL1634239.1 Pr6Pr family membrane protein [Luteimonas galliterrae]
MRAAGEERDGQAWLAALVAAVAVAALMLQYAILMRSTLETIGLAYATLRFFSYFTVLSNLLVACVAVGALSSPGAGFARFFSRPAVKGGVALYIGVTGTIYFLILRHLWQPQGAQWWADTGLHYASPVLYLAWWLLGVRHGMLRWSAILRWLAFPLGYLLWAFLRGAWVHEYPYPFIDVGQLGWATVFRNAVGILAAFVGLGVLLVAVDRLLGKFRAL